MAKFHIFCIITLYENSAKWGTRQCESELIGFGIVAPASINLFLLFFLLFFQSPPLFKLCTTQKITQTKASNDFWSFNDMQ